MAAVTERVPLTRRQMRATAEVALQRYDLGPARLRLVADKYNTVFRVATSDAVCALRVGVPQRSALDVRSELAWIAALRRDTDLSIVEPVETRTGEGLVTVGDRQCVLFRWTGGRSSGPTPSPNMAGRLGDLAAALHNHAETFQPPAEFTAVRWSHAWPDSLRSLLDGDGPVLPPSRRDLFREAIARAQATLDTLHAEGAVRFLHMDLHPWNVKVTGGRLTVFDFDDSAWAHPLQDIAASLHSFQRFPHAPALRQAFLQGYAARRSLSGSSVGHLDLLLAARELDVVASMLGSGHVSPGRAVQRLEEADRRLRAWIG